MLKSKIIFLFFFVGNIALNTSVFAQSDERNSKATRLVKDKGQTIKLQSTIVGDKEQPAISYFVPWKGTDRPNKLNWNIENKHDNTLDIVDRDVLRRSMNIYDEMDLE